MSCGQYAMVYCVTCRQKTPWCGQPSIKVTRNNKYGLRGTCPNCKKTKFSFITRVYYQSQQNTSSTAASGPNCGTTTPPPQPPKCPEVPKKC